MGGGNTGTGAIGTILEWCKGKDGVSGTSKLVLNNIIGPTFAMGATFAPGFKIFDVREITRAGQEGRHLLNLRLASVGSDFADNGSDYSKNYYAHGVGNEVLNVGKSYSSGQICGWSPDESGKSGILSLEFPKGRFDLNETVLQMTPKFEVVGNGFSGPGRIISISTELENVPSVYDLTTTVRVS